MRIIGFTNLPATMPGSATQMYAKNIQTLVKHLVVDGKLNLDFSDEITAGATITHGGKVVHEATARRSGSSPQSRSAAAAPAAGSACRTIGQARIGSPEKGGA